jgi:hypothetical protein
MKTSPIALQKQQTNKQNVKWLTQGTGMRAVNLAGQARARAEKSLDARVAAAQLKMQNAGLTLTRTSVLTADQRLGTASLLDERYGENPQNFMTQLASLTSVTEGSEEPGATAFLVSNHADRLVAFALGFPLSAPSASVSARVFHKLFHAINKKPVSGKDGKTYDTLLSEFIGAKFNDGVAPLFHDWRESYRKIPALAQFEKFSLEDNQQDQIDMAYLLSQVIVKPELRGKGIATVLLDAQIKAAQSQWYPLFVASLVLSGDVVHLNDRFLFNPLFLSNPSTRHDGSGDLFVAKAI